MKLMSADEALALLEEHRTANIRNYIRTSDDGEEVVVIPEGRSRPVMAAKIVDGVVVEIALTNGQKARNNDVVYLIRADNGLVKIGFTNNLSRRLHNLNCASPVGLSLIGCIKTAIAETIEAELHERYKAFRVRGEWFRLSDEDVHEILGGTLWRDPPS